ncbi:outer membrane lipoprotein LolB [Duganella sp. SG902]|uniref:outer membrane lipoprotein LolB n=1 Tax=Duganella sp. SG902 TaxID=2587016 RepID=UPI00159D5D4B|nr:lipoprotein insertase outer membrane protein LolB [Duganella sp. SG902]NVM75854.1 outer membrane lipoprotein LolB [Duganella sp. SG902]
MKRPLLTALIIAALAGCVTTPSVPRSTAAVAPYRDNVELAGRIAINYSRDGKKESLNGKFTWQQSKANTDVSLISPTGQTVAVINVTPTSATLKESGKPPRSAPDLDALTRQTLGWTLPVSGLRDWLQGYAVASDGQRFVATPANDSVITRDGWKLEYVSWQDENAAVPAPKRIDATRIALGQAVDDMAIRIVIDPAAQ